MDQITAYDKNGKKINDNGGNTTDYMYDDNGNVISSTSVKVTYSQGGEVNSSFEGYGFRHYTQGTGGAVMDPSFDIVSAYVGGSGARAAGGVIYDVYKLYRVGKLGEAAFNNGYIGGSKEENEGIENIVPSDKISLGIDQNYSIPKLVWKDCI
ncbi:hypothetical protein FQR65_LT19906 [Abscondita terminalis]|nr:hypothetical protein FQR65_LT19906 [Abscondita terminalis]